MATALISGASSGIGHELAQQLAARGDALLPGKIAANRRSYNTLRCSSQEPARAFKNRAMVVKNSCGRSGG